MFLEYLRDLNNIRKRNNTTVKYYEGILKLHDNGNITDCEFDEITDHIIDNLLEIQLCRKIVIMKLDERFKHSTVVGGLIKEIKKDSDERDMLLNKLKIFKKK